MRWSLILLLGICCAPFMAGSQVNIKIGYGANWLNPEVHNSIYSEYNSAHPWLDNELQDLKFLQGLQLGLRYRTDYDVALELTWANYFKRNISTGTDPADNASFYRRVSYNMNEVGLGLEYIFGSIGLGTSINGDFLRTGIRRTEGGNTRTLSNDLALSSSILISIHSGKSGLLSATIRPYVKIPWTSFDFSSLNTELNGTSQNLTDDFMTFGVSLIFFNGN